MAEELPIWNPPEVSGLYKVLQFESEGRPYMRFSHQDMFSDDESLTFESHNSILKRFADEIGVVPITSRSLDKPILPQGCGYDLVGGGTCLIDVSARSASFSGNTLDYLLDMNGRHVQLVSGLLPEWNLKYNP